MHRGGSSAALQPPPAAFSVDLRSFESRELPPPRARQQHTPASAAAPPHDPDIWSPPLEQTPPGCFGPPPPLAPGYGPASSSVRQQTRREREEAYERARREGHAPPYSCAHGRGMGTRLRLCACAAYPATAPAALTCLRLHPLHPRAAAKRGAGGNPFSGVKPRVNTGAKRSAAGEGGADFFSAGGWGGHAGGLDPRIEALLDRYGPTDQERACLPA